MEINELIDLLEVALPKLRVIGEQHPLRRIEDPGDLYSVFSDACHLLRSPEFSVSDFHLASFQDMLIQPYGGE